jgi:acetyl/propionyl-CoA carboxylase alpha subunit
MNTRLQVEHPVTELVTGVDLVDWQLRVAAGEPLPASQDDLRQVGHAIEVRLYAEDPAGGFLPQTGTVARFDVPTGPGIRVDSGVESGSEVSRFYDPMLAKLIVHADDRDTAIGRLRDLLAHTVVHGVRTNLAHLADTVAHPVFAAGDLDTGFLDRHLPDWHPAPPTGPELAAVAAVLAAAPEQAAPDPWRSMGPWRLSAAGGTPVRLAERRSERFADRRGERTAELRGDRGAAGSGAASDGEHVATVRRQGGRRTVSVDGQVHTIDAVADGRVRVDGTPMALILTRTGDEVWAHVGGRTHRWYLVPATRHADASEMAGAGTLTSPMPGAVLDVRVGEGDHVTAGQVLVVVEAMKMEHPVAAPADGVVTTVHVAVGDAVEGDAPLLTFEPQDR